MVSLRGLNRFAVPALVFGLTLVALFLPWRTFPTNLSLLLSAALWFLFHREHISAVNKKTQNFIFLFLAVYAVEVVGIIHTQNMSYGLFRLETKLPLLGFPVIILASRINHAHITRIIWVFIASLMLACTWCLIYAIASILSEGAPLSSFFSSPMYAHIEFTRPLQQLHPTYLTLFICSAVFFISEHIRKSKHYVWAVAIAYLLLFVVPLSSRAGIVAAFFTVLYIGARSIGTRRKVALIVYSLVITALATFTVFFVPSVKSRMVDSFLQAELKTDQINSVSFHYKSWYCSVTMWLEGNWLFGYGTGDEVITISDCYAAYGWTDYRHDAHNEYLSSLLKHGLLGLAILLAALLYPLYLAFRREDWYYMHFLLVVMICFLSESMLRAQSGLVFYAFFNALLFKRLLLSSGEDTPTSS
jgi:O-antigen ligase